MYSFQRGAEFCDDPNALISIALQWVLAAGDPYYSWVFGGKEQATTILENWMRRSSSEVSMLRVSFLKSASEVLGGFIAMGGADLKRARKADAVAIAKSSSGSTREAFMARLANGSNLFPPVADAEYYLSKMGLGSSFIGKGHGRRLLDQFIRDGDLLGYMRYRLDVHVGNLSAISLYEHYGFAVADRHLSLDGALGYCSMVLER
jgi:ribosomal protein S18 acetylase RimI-like enzyme